MHDSPARVTGCMKHAHDSGQEKVPNHLFWRFAQLVGFCLIALTVGLLVSPAASCDAWAPPRGTAVQAVQFVAGPDKSFPAIVSDAEGRIHLFWNQNDELGGAIVYAQQEGGTWVQTDVIAGRNMAGPSACVSPSGYLHLVWAEGGQIRHSVAHVHEAISVRAWSAPISVALEDGSAPYLTCGSDDVLHLFYSVKTKGSSVEYLRSEDQGMTWDAMTLFVATEDDVVTDGPQAAIGSDGVIHLIWSLMPEPERYGGRGVYYARSTDNGLSWSSSARLDRPAGAPDELAWQASIAVVGSDEVHAVWDAHAYSGERRHAWSADGGLNWTQPEPVKGKLVAQTGVNPMVVDAAGTLYLIAAGTPSWDDPLGVFISVWEGREWSHWMVVDRDSRAPHYVRATLSGGNLIHMAWNAAPGVWHRSILTGANGVAAESYPTVAAVTAGDWATVSREASSPPEQHATSMALLPRQGRGVSTTGALDGLSLGALAAAGVLALTIAARACIGKKGGRR